MENPRLIQAPGQVLRADTSWVDEAGWTHFANCARQRLLLSIYTDREDFGNLNDSLVIRAGLNDSYGQQAVDLSNSDYIDNDLWFAMNRFWQIENAIEISETARIRFYYDPKDMMDVATTMAEYGLTIDERRRLFMFSITGNELYPLDFDIQANNGIFNLYAAHNETTPINYVNGEYKGLWYAELETTTLEISGGGGYLLFLPDDPLTISGTIASDEEGHGVDDVLVQCQPTSDMTDEQGVFDCDFLDAGADYVVRPEKFTNYEEHVTVLDINRLYLHLLGEQVLNNAPRRRIAADVDLTETITQADLDQIQRLILQVQNDFVDAPSWRFIPKNYQFPNPNNPYNPPFPETLKVENIIGDVIGQDFAAIKLGNVAHEGDYPNILNIQPEFSLTDVDVFCGQGDEFSVDVEVANFNKLTGFQFTIEWDAEKINFLSLTNINLDYLGADNINQLPVSEGKMTFAWTSLPLDLNGISVNDNTAIFRLNFVLANREFENTEVRFTESITPKQVLLEDFSVANTIYNNSFINIAGSSVQAQFMIENVSCFGENDGSIQLIPFGGQPPFQIEWSNGATTTTIENLPPGIYDVNVMDQSDCPFVLEGLVVSEPEPLLLNAEVDPITCKGGSDGSIEIAPTGGTSPYQIAWTGGSTTGNVIENLAPGVYMAGVMDANGCETNQTIEIENPRPITVGADVRHATGLDQPDGSVHIRTMFYGHPPFSYLWSTGSTEDFIEGLIPGNYRLTVTDSEGCQNLFGYEIDVLITGLKTTFDNLEIAITNNPGSLQNLPSVIANSTAFQKIKYTIYGIGGKQLFQNNIQFPAGTSTLPLPEFPTIGMYFLKLENEQASQVFKIVIY